CRSMHSMMSTAPKAAQPLCGREAGAGFSLAPRPALARPHAGLSRPAPFRGTRLVVTSVSAPEKANSTTPAAETTKPPFTAWDTAVQRVAKRTDIKSVLVLGAGPIVIGQVQPGQGFAGACEFDYSGTQACKALKAEGYRVILLNSNPATIMTDPETADATYVGPMTPELVEPILARERPDAILPTMGGQTALNLAKNLSENGVLAKYNVELIGAKLESINKAEDRDLFSKVGLPAMEKLNLKMAASAIATNMDEAMVAADKIGAFPLIIRPAFTLGGTGGGIAYNMDEFKEIVNAGLTASMTTQARCALATGFPIAKMAARLACGNTLDQIPNDITRKTPASFEPSIDYVVTKIPRFAFEKFPGAAPVLTTQMKSVGEAMAIGRTFQESFQKALRSLETGLDGWSLPPNWKRQTPDKLQYNMRVPNPERMVVIKQALEDGLSIEEVHEYTSIDPWFLAQLQELHEAETWLKTRTLAQLSPTELLELKRRGFSDPQIGRCTGASDLDVRAARVAAGVVPSMKRVDTCAAEFEAATPYMYSSYDGECECEATTQPKVLILGGGPNRIGQGIEFDYCCCHASYALRDAGYETIMMNSNPETVSTDYDTSSRLYFEPLTVEDVLNVIEKERPEGIIVQFGGQTPLKLAAGVAAWLEAHPIPAASGRGNVSIWGTSPDAIDEAEDRDRWMALLDRLSIRQPPGGVATNEEQALAIAERLTYPVMVRPSFVLGGRAMEIVHSAADIHRYITTAVEVDPARPVLVDKYLDRADELDVDALADREGNVVICGILQHIEQAGVHSGDSACTIPPQTIPQECLDVIRDWTPKLAKALKVVGFLNIQYAVQDGKVFIIEANPRASRTVPFVAKAVGHPLAKYASLLISRGPTRCWAPEMRSTGEVMGIDVSFAKAFAKAAIAAGQRLPASGNVFITMEDKYKDAIVPSARLLADMGYGILATKHTAEHLTAAGVPGVTSVLKIQEGRPSAADLLRNDDIAMMIITSTGDEADVRDGRDLRRLALAHKVPIITTIAGAKATVGALQALKEGALEQVPLQDYFPKKA
ncbi:hypothetical protein APUTEX25_004984, partial [Auxenochlorella protothecoides]